MRIERCETTAQRGTGEAALAATAEVVPTSTLLVTGAASRVAPNILSIAHWDRLLRGALYAPLRTASPMSFVQRVALLTGVGGHLRAPAESVRGF